MAAAVESVSPVTLAGGTMLLTFLTTNKSPGWLWVINSASTRESEQVMNRVSGAGLTGKFFEERAVMSELLLVEAVDAFNESLHEHHWLWQNRLPLIVLTGGKRLEDTAFVVRTAILLLVVLRA